MHLWESSASLGGVAQWRPRHALGGHFGAVVGVCWGVDGRCVLSASEDQTARLFTTVGRHWCEMTRMQVRKCPARAPGLGRSGGVTWVREREGRQRCSAFGLRPQRTCTHSAGRPVPARLCFAHAHARPCAATRKPCTVLTSMQLRATVLCGAMPCCAVLCPQVHGHNFSCIASVPTGDGQPYCYVSGSEEKVLRVLESPQVGAGDQVGK